jgi:predicted amidohydrolase
VPSLNVALVQTDTRWHDAAANRAALDASFARLPPATDLVVLPEMFTTGFTMAAATVAERMDGPTLRWLAAAARQLDTAIAGSLVIESAGAHLNRLVWVTPDGTVQTYDKRHLFRMAGEHEHYAAGRARLVVEWRGFRICPLVCYDLRFPVFSRNRNDYDVLLYVANWPAARQQAWQALLRARAIENLCYVIGVNRVGVDGNGLAYAGGSAVYDWLGAARAETAAQTGVFPVALDPGELAGYRRSFPAWQDADAFDLK